MNQKISLREVERGVFQASLQDGLIDIFVGLVLSQMAIAPYLSRYLGDFWSSFVFLPVWLVAYLILRWVRQRYIKPRLGQMSAGSWRRRRMKRFNLLMLVILTASLILGALSAVQIELVPGWIHAARLSLVMLITSSLAAYFLDTARFYLYGLLVAAAPIVGELLYQEFQVPHHGFPVSFGLASLTLILTGLVLLFRLLRRLPPQPVEFPAEETA